ncbi:MAG: PEP/pyruvate-binding domain-containing protein [Dehalococcoidia bacterium]
MAYVEWLNAGPLSREIAGGKGASLSELVAAGFTVPPGFSVVAEGYRHFIDANDLEGRIDAVLRITDLMEPTGAREAAEQISSLVLAAPLPEDLSEEIASAYDALVTRSGIACAVRSSAISEDGESASFAGLYETYLNVAGVGEVLDRVRRCYASLWSERGVRYRAKQASGAGTHEAMAVVVMGLVQSEVSGIAFTAHPVTGATDQVVINASWGLGEAIVAGLVTPDSFVVEKDSFTVLEREICEKELAHLPHPSGVGTVETLLDAEQASAPSLQDDEAVAVAQMAVRIEAHYGSPQDIEWAMQGGQLYLLQSRPITTL